MIQKKTFEILDWRLLLPVLALCFIGILSIYSSTQALHDKTFLWRQCFSILLGLVVCAITIKIDYHTFTDYIPYLYGFAVLLLVAVLIFGKEINGNKSWLVVAGLQFQPSEGVKVLMIIMLARVLSNVRHEQLSLQELIICCLIAALPTVLVVLQGDLGTALTYIPIALVLVFLIGIPRRSLVVALVALALLVPAGWASLKTYQRQRIIATLNPDLDPKGIGYQARQSKIALGSGGFLGKGFKQGSQARLGFIPEHQTDFVFAGLTEERGLLGALVTLGLYWYLLMRTLAVTRVARDRIGILMVVGVVAMLAVHIVVNIGMVTGLLPVIGIPLPLLSYGGSSCTATLFGIGLVLSVQLRRYGPVL